MLTALLALSTLSFVGFLWRHLRVQPASPPVAPALSPDAALRFAYEGADLGVWAWRVGEKHVHTSERWCTMLGYDAATFTLTTDTWQALTHPDDAEGVHAAIQAHISGNTEFYETTHRMRTADGAWRWILNRARVLQRDAAGKPTLVAGTHMDVTTQKEAEAALAQTAALQAAITAAFPDLVFRIDRQGVYQAVHASEATRLAAPPETIVGLSITDVMAPEIATVALEKISRVLATGVPESMEYALPSGTETHHYEARIARFGADEVIAVVRDVTERVQQQLFLRQVIDTSPNLILVKDADGRVVLANEAIAALLGRPLEEIVGHTDAELFPQTVSDLGSLHEADQYVLSTGDSLLLAEQCLTDAAGNGRYFQTRKTRMAGVQGPPRVLVVAEDVTARHEIEQQLSQSEAWTQRVLTSVTDGFYVVDSHWTVQMINPQAERLFNLSAEALVGHNLWDVFPAAVGTTFWHEYHRAIETREPASFTAYYAPFQAWREVRAVPFEGGLAVFFTDVTEQRQREETLQQRQERMQFLHEITSQPHLDVDTLLQQTLQQTAEVLGMEIGLVAHIEAGRYTVVQAISPPEVPITAGDTFELDYTYCALAFGGTGVMAVHHVAESPVCLTPAYKEMKLEAYIGVPLVVDGARFGMLCFSSTTPRAPFTDVDEETMHLLGQWVSGMILRRQHNAAVQASEARFRRLAETSSDLICTHNPDFTYRYASPAMQARLGYAPTHIVGRSPFEFIHPEDAPYLRMLLTPASLRHMGGEELRVEFRYRHSEGHYVWLETLVHVHFDAGGRPQFIQTNSRDITLRKGFEKELERTAEALEARNAELAHARDAALSADRAKSQFLANMSHEIRTPLNGLVGASDLLKETTLTPGQEELVGILQTSSSTLLSLINDILDLSKIEAGHLELCVEPFCVRDLARDAANLIRFKAQEKNLALHIEVDESVPHGALGDENRLRQVLLNLLSNAVKFTHEGSVTLRVQARPASGGHALTFHVADTGIGIPPDKQRHLFERFNQLDASTTKRYGGTGLGLAISQQLVGMMNGQIGVESQPGQGTTFSFTVELAEAHLDRSVASTPSQPLLTPAEHLAGRTLLAVEDHPINQRVLLRILEGMGLQADVAVNGVEALEKLDAAFYDVVLMDVQMPEMDGLTCTRTIRARAGAQPWIIGLTANALAGDREETLAAGMDDYVPKPIRRDALEAALLRVERALSSAC